MCLAGGILSSTVINAPSGWTLIVRQDNANTAAAAYWALGNVASFTFTVVGAVNVVAECSAFSGRNTSSPITASLGQSDASTTVNAPSVVAVAGDDSLCFWESNQNAIFGAIGGGYTERAADSAGANNLRAATGTLDNVSAGATGNQSRTATNFQNKNGLQIAIAKAASGPSFPYPLTKHMRVL